MSLKQNKKVATWFRGFDSKYGVYGEETPHLLWLTTDWIYAKEFGDSIMEYKIDMSKCHGSIDGMGYLFNFDMSEGPSAEYATYLLNEFGVNSYRYYGGLTESSYCMCLWDETPIVSQRVLDNNELNESKNMKKKVMKINESQLRNMIVKSVKKVLKENSEKLNNVYWELDEHLKKAIDLSSKLIELGSKEGNKEMMGYATTVQNALQTLCYEKLDKQEYDSSSIYPKNHWGGLAMSELYPDDTDK